MTYRLYPNVDRALRQLDRTEGDFPVDDYRLSTRDDHDFVYDDDHVQRCTRCRHPHSQWAGGPFPGVPQDWKPGSYV